MPLSLNKPKLDNLAAEIWKSAERLRGKFKAYEYQNVVLSIFYLNLLNDKERGPDDQLSIGVILCAEKDDIEVEYALRTKTNPIGVATYVLQSRLSAAMKGKLPSARQLRAVVRSVLPEGREKGK